MTLLLIGEEHIREKVARHHESLARHGIRTCFFIDDRSGITRRLEREWSIDVRYSSNPAGGLRPLLRYWFDFRRCFREVRPDVVEVYTSINWFVLLPMVVFVKVHRTPVTVVCRGELYTQNFKRHSAPLRGAFRLILRIADLIIYKEMYMPRLLDAYAPRTRRIPWTNAVPVRPAPSLAREGNHVLFLNFFKPWRNLELIIAAAPQVRAAIPDVEFHLVGGSGELAHSSPFYEALLTYEDSLRKLIENSGVSSCVHLHPFTSDVQPHYDRAKVFLLPADLVFCNYALLEAMEHGIPPVVSNEKDPAAELLVEDGVNGFCIPADAGALADRIIALLRDEPLRQRLGQAAHEKVATEFNLERQIRTLVDSYRALVAETLPATAPREP